MLVQIYVDDISFGSTNPTLTDEFRTLMESKFEMNCWAENIETGEGFLKT